MTLLRTRLRALELLLLEEGVAGGLDVASGADIVAVVADQQHVEAIQAWLGASTDNPTTSAAVENLLARIGVRTTYVGGTGSELNSRARLARFLATRLTDAPQAPSYVADNARLQFIQVASEVEVDGHLRVDGNLRPDAALPHVIVVTPEHVPPADGSATTFLNQVNDVLNRQYGDVSCFRFVATADGAVAANWLRLTAGDGWYVVVRWRARTFQHKVNPHVQGWQDRLWLWIASCLVQERLTIVLGDPGSKRMMQSLMQDIDIALVAHGCVDHNVRRHVLQDAFQHGRSAFHAGDEVVDSVLQSLAQDSSLAPLAKQVAAGGVELAQRWVEVVIMTKPRTSEVYNRIVDMDPTPQPTDSAPVLHTVVVLGHGSAEEGVELHMNSDSEDDDDGDFETHAGFFHPLALASHLSDAVQDGRCVLGSQRLHIVVVTCGASVWTDCQQLSDICFVTAAESRTGNDVVYPRDAASLWRSVGRWVATRWASWLATAFANTMGAPSTRYNARRAMLRLLRQAYAVLLESKIEQLAAASYTNNGMLDPLLARLKYFPAPYPLDRANNFFLAPFAGTSFVRVAAWPSGKGDCYSIAVKPFHDPNAAPMWFVVDGGYGSRYFGRGVWSHMAAIPERTQYASIDATFLTHVDTDHVNGLLAWAKECHKSPQDNVVGLGMVVTNVPATDIDRAWRGRHARSIGTLRHLTDKLLDALLSSVTTRPQLAKHTLVHRPYRGDEITQLPDTAISVGRFHSPEGWANYCGASVMVVHPPANLVETEYDNKLGEELGRSDRGTTVANTVGAVFLFSFVNGSRTVRCLFCGDAIGDDIVEGLNAKNVELSYARPLDLLTVPHHGSGYNSNQAFFDAVPSNGYVISTNGSHHHPHDQVLIWLAQALLNRHRTRALGRGSVHVVFTYADSLHKRTPAADLRALLRRHHIEDRVRIGAVQQTRDDNPATLFEQGRRCFTW